MTNAYTFFTDIYLLKEDLAQNLFLLTFNSVLGLLLYIDILESLYIVQEEIDTMRRRNEFFTGCDYSWNLIAKYRDHSEAVGTYYSVDDVIKHSKYYLQDLVNRYNLPSSNYTVNETYYLESDNPVITLYYRENESSDYFEFCTMHTTRIKSVSFDWVKPTPYPYDGK